MKGKHENLGAFHSRSILCLAEIIYRYDPSLRPFNNGDRAGSFGKETAEQFAARKWFEYNKDCACSGRPRQRGKNPVRNKFDKTKKRTYTQGGLAVSSDHEYIMSK